MVMVKLIKVVIGYNSELIMLGMKALLQNSTFEVAGEAPLTQEILAEVEKIKPHILILPLVSQERSSLAICKQVKELVPETNVVILTALAEEKAMEAAIEAGASGYVLETVKSHQLLKILELIALGKTFFDTGNDWGNGVQLTEGGFFANKPLDPKLQEHFELAGENKPVVTGSGSGYTVKLTETEQKIVNLVAEGKTNKQIAALLFISDKTVRNHLSRVLTKLRLTNRTQVAQYYYQAMEKK